MPYSIRKLPCGKFFKVINKETGRVVAYHTDRPKELVKAIEINKKKRRNSI